LQRLSLEGAYLYQDLQALFSSERIKKQLTGLWLENFPYALSEQFYSLKQLCALKNLGISECRWFNDDSFQRVVESFFKNSLKILQLNKVSLSDKVIDSFPQFRNLSHLLLGSTFALTNEGYQRFLKSPNLQRSLHTLCLDNLPLSDQEVKRFKDFTDLQALILSNDSNLPIDSKGVEFLGKLAFQRNWQFELSWGEMDFIGLFSQAVRDESHF
jgi:hypothetical protein